MSQLPALLRTDLSQMAERVRRAGRGRDTMLAHITPQEAELLRARGGSGTINPATGLPEFFDFPPDDVSASDPLDRYEPEDLDVQPRFPVTPVIADSPPIFQGGGDEGQYTPTIFYPTAPQDFSVFPVARQAQGDIERAAAGSGLGADVLYDSMPINLGPTGFPLGESVTQQPGFEASREQALRNLQEAAARPARGGIEDALRGAARQAGEFVKTPLGYGAIGGIPALLQARRASQQARGMREELGRLGQEARTQGQQLVAQARGGQVTAAQQQALDAQRAAAMQNLSRRGITGGTAAQQVERSLQDQKGRFLEETLNQGMRLLQVADQYTERAIRAQYAADAQAQQLLGNFFQNYMRVLAGQPGTTTTTPTSTPTR